MRILRVAMRHEIESGDVVARQRPCAPAFFRASNLLCGFAVAFVLTGVRQAHADIRSPARQIGSISGIDRSAPKGVPPHAPGYLGILFQNLSEDQLAALHLKGRLGVEVLMVDHDGPAGKAGLRPHDVILTFNGQPITDADALRRMIHDDGVGTGVSLGLFRGGREVTVTTQLAYRGTVEREAMERMALPAPAAGEDGIVGGFVESYDVESSDTATGRGPGFLAQMLHGGPFTGLVLEAMEPQLAGFFGVAGGGGLLVETVMPNSPASAAGLRAGDVVLRVDAVGVKSTNEWMRRLHASKGQAVTLTVIRDRREINVTLIPQLKKHSKVEWLQLFGDQPAPDAVSAAITS
jgi:serine protease Do